ncbi:NTP transferase domain-containing protein [Candidatus Woesearchaeota archaeon]|nr:NTP transferase domain-containing protein [Candidatus Woesearchaeota archaeon]
MQAVILAAGKSTRTYPLTLTRPKPLLKAANKAILERNLEAVKGLADEIIMVVGYGQEMIKKFILEKYPKLKIKYIEQKKQLGTGHAVSVVKNHINGRFILMMGDDIYQRQDIKICIKSKYSILVTKVKNPGNFGVVQEKNGVLVNIIEKPEKFISNSISTALYVLDGKIFKYVEKAGKGPRGEYEFPDALVNFAKKQKIHCIKTTKYLPVAYPWDLLKADKFFRKNKNSIGKNSKITGFVKNSSVGSDCIINGNIKNSIIMDNAIIGKNSVVEDSIIGENVSFDGKIISKNNTVSIVKNKRINAGRLGAIIGDNVTAKNVIINPGCKIWPNKIIENKTIRNDVL